MNEEMFGNLEKAMNIGQCNTATLGGVVVISALLTELALTDLIFAESRKVRYAITNNANINELVAIDNSVAGVLGQVCCIEGHVVEKLNAGIDLINPAP